MTTLCIRECSRINRLLEYIVFAVSSAFGESCRLKDADSALSHFFNFVFLQFTFVIQQDFTAERSELYGKLTLTC